MPERIKIDPEIKEYLLDLTMESGKRADRDGRSLAERRKEAEEAQKNREPKKSDSANFLD